jgi:choline kinase
MIASPVSAVAVNNARVAEEEIKYTLNSEGYINAISKTVAHAKGEALGINLIKADHLATFKRALERVADQDYFERAMELMIAEHGNVFKPLDVGHLGCVEVDFAEDLERAKTMVSDNS